MRDISGLQQSLSVCERCRCRRAFAHTRVRTQTHEPEIKIDRRHCATSSSSLLSAQQRRAHGGCETTRSICALCAPHSHTLACTHTHTHTTFTHADRLHASRRWVCIFVGVFSGSILRTCPTKIASADYRSVPQCVQCAADATTTHFD